MTEPPKTKAQEVYETVNAMIAAGTSKADAFKQLAAERRRPLGSIRGAYYSITSGRGGTPRRTKRRETLPQDAFADARRTLETAIEAIDTEVAAAETRAREAASEHEAMAAAADGRKEEIRAKLDALT